MMSDLQVIPTKRFIIRKSQPCSFPAFSIRISYACIGNLYEKKKVLDLPIRWEGEGSSPASLLGQATALTHAREQLTAVPH